MEIGNLRTIIHFTDMLILVIGISHGQTVNITGPPAVEQGTDTVITCTGGAAPHIFIWTDVSVIPNVRIFTAGEPAYPEDNTDYFNFAVSENGDTSTLTITNTLISNEGTYICNEGQATDEKSFAVEVASTRTLSLASTIVNSIDMYQATCEVRGGRPNETITWELGDDGSPCPDPEETPLPADPGLFSKRSVCTFQADSMDNGKTLKCVISGHQVTTLNGEKTAILNHRTTTDPPTTESEPFITDGITSESSEPTPCHACSCTGLNTGASAGIAVLTVLLLASITINIIQFIVWRRQETYKDDRDSQMISSSKHRNEVRETNDNTAYEMITSGEKAYTALKLGPSGSSSSPIIAPENVTFLTRLGSIGRGDFGGVWKGELRLNQDQASIAIRQLPDQVTKSTSVLQSIKVLFDLPSQPNIVKCLGYCQQQGSILYEFISGGTLLTHLQTTGVQSQPTYNNLKPNRVRVDKESLLNFAWQIAKGMQFLSSKNIIHGTLCAHNVLLDERKQCKLADYGIATSLFNKRGKPTRWTSPETMTTGVQSTEGDIWSFGIVLWEIVTLGARPYPNMTFDIVRKEVVNGFMMPRPRHCGQEVYDVMTLCWEKEGRNRISFGHILKNLEKILEKNHNYLSLNDLDEGLYASSLDM